MNIRDWLPWYAVAFAGGFAIGVGLALWVYWSVT